MVRPRGGIFSAQHSNGDLMEKSHSSVICYVFHVIKFEIFQMVKSTSCFDDKGYNVKKMHTLYILHVFVISRTTFSINSLLNCFSKIRVAEVMNDELSKY